ncbi:MAG TPA: hypothetical protein VHN80_24685, partial [Kineosporiaceae bacterium]|nr:hypothetical protein [Kineosporiaceae bacterium]
VYSAVGSPTTSNRINLVTTSGPAPEQRPWFAGAGEGTEPTGIVLAAPAGKALGAALSEACGDVGPVMSLVPPGGVRYDAATRDLAVTALVDVTPGKVSALSLQPDATQHRDRLTATPAWTTTPRSRPDAAGQVRITVHYRAPAAGPCQSVGATLLAAVATMRVPGATGERVVRYSLFLDMARDTQAVSRLCGAS